MGILYTSVSCPYEAKSMIDQLRTLGRIGLLAAVVYQVLLRVYKSTFNSMIDWLQKMARIGPLITAAKCSVSHVTCWQGR